MKKLSAILYNILLLLTIIGCGRDTSKELTEIYESKLQIDAMKIFDEIGLSKQLASEPLVDDDSIRISYCNPLLQNYMKEYFTIEFLGKNLQSKISAKDFKWLQKQASFVETKYYYNIEKSLETLAKVGEIVHESFSYDDNTKFRSSIKKRIECQDVKIKEIGENEISKIVTIIINKSVTVSVSFSDGTIDVTMVKKAQ